MKITPRAATAIDLITQTLVEFRERLATLDNSLDILIDSITELKTTGDLSTNAVTRMEESSKIIQALPIDGMAIIGPALEIIQRELVKGI